MIPRKDHVHDYLDDYLHDLLSADDADYVERHCDTCPRCRAALREARKRLAALEAVPPAEASEDLVENTVERVERHEESRRRWRRRIVAGVLATAAAAALVIGGLHYRVANATVTPYDLRVLGQTQMLAGANGSLRVRLVDRQTGKPMAGVPVDIGLRRKGTDQTVTVASFQTDADGTGQPRFVVPEAVEGDADLIVTAKTPDEPELLTQKVRVQRSRQVMLTSDKPVYQPGQTIHVRSLALRRPDLRAVAGEDAVFTVTDPKGNVVFKQKGKTSAYGIAATDCDLASELIEGPYVIACKVGDTDSKLNVEVKKYVLPKFKVGVALDKPYYAPGQPVQITVEADYFFGKPVAGGNVELEVSAAEAGQKTVHRSNRKTDASGKAVFSFDLPRSLAGRPQDGGDARLSVQAAVTDTAGQTQGRASSTVVTTRPLRFEVIPENGRLVDGVPNTVFVMVSYADGRPAAKARLTVPGAAKELVANDLGVASFEMTPTAGDYTATIEARDDKGLTARREVRLSAGVGQDFLFRTDRAVYDGGQPMKLTVLGGGVEPVFVDVIKDGQTFLTQTVNLSNGRGEYELDLPAELFGTVQVCAYRLDQEGVPVRKTRTLYVRPPAGLELTATTDRPEYRPGEMAKVQFQLRGKDGKPARGAVSLAAVDEAVFSVLQQRPGMEGKFFTLEQELLEPVYALYPWSPDLTTSLPPDEQDRFEQALFARTTRSSNQPGAKPTGPGPRGGGRFAPNAPAPGIAFPEEAGPVVQGVSPHTLVAASFPVKTAETERERSANLRLVQRAWVMLGLALAFLAYVGVWAFVRPLWVVGVLHGVGLVVLCIVGFFSMLFVAQKSARFAAEADMAVGEAVRQDMAKAAPMAPGWRDTPQPPPPTEVPSGAGGAGGPAPVRVRQLFPETLLWRPELITDDEGRATLDVALADSITNWRLTASAITAEGRLGAAQAGIKVFQPFFVDLNLPVALTRNDEVSVPVVVYNYLDKPQTVELALEGADWFDRLDGGAPAQKVELGPREVRSLSYRLKVKKVGSHHLQVTARAAGIADAVKRPIEVVPDGRRVEQVVNGSLHQPADVDLTVPDDAIEGSAKAFLKIYPSGFSQLVEGLDGIFRMPSGCFEQTSSTTYPNVLALDYLRKTNKGAPEVEAKARQYIHLGYQRLLTFEVSGGGFDWFGRPPANRTLTAYGLMEFQDMAKVHDVDPALIDRTRRWLLAQRKPDGSWPAERGMINDGLAGSVQVGKDPDLSTTAYVAWAVFGGEQRRPEADATRRYLLSFAPSDVDDPNVLALVCNALNAIEPGGSEVKPYLDRLEGLKKTSDDGKFCWWEQAPGGRTTFYGSGVSGSVETTALAVLAMLPGGHNPGTTRSALAWLVKQKDGAGTWRSTQATVLALKALLAGTGEADAERERRIEVAWDGQTQEVVIPADQSEVMRQIDLSAGLKPGTRRLTLTEKSGTAANFQVAFRHHVPSAGGPGKNEPLAVRLSYDRTEMQVDDTMTATATVTNQMKQAAPMVILDLPIPAGFALSADDLASMVQAGTIARYQVTPRSAIVYLRGLQPGASLKLTYRLRATMPVKAAVPAAQAYEYYDVDKRGKSAEARVTVTAR
jgi:hypothetical protein